MTQMHALDCEPLRLAPPLLLSEYAGAQPLSGTRLTSTPETGTRDCEGLILLCLRFPAGKSEAPLLQPP